MREIDRKIREALRAEEADLFDSVGGEMSVTQMVIDSFRGRSRWLVVLSFAYVLVFAVLAVLAAMQFSRAEGTREMILWSTAFITCILVVTMTKIWYWMELTKNAVMREVKRVELQLAQLASRTPAQRP